MQPLKKPPTLNDCVFAKMRNFQRWTFWELQEAIKSDYGIFYGEPTISAAIRELRKPTPRLKYRLPTDGEVVLRERRQNGKGYTYRLNPIIRKQWGETNERV